MTELLHMWTVFESPSDAPGLFVVRRFVLHDDHVEATLDAHYSRDLDELRELMRRKGLHRVGRCDADEPRVVESWV